MEHIGFLQSVWTVVVFIIFIAIVLWAWSSRRQTEFDEVASVALDLPKSKSEKK